MQVLIQEYITYALEVILISVTEGELLLVKVCDLPSEKNMIENNISFFSYAFTLLC